MAKYDIVAGTTSNIQFQLLENSAAINLAGCAIALLLEDYRGNAISNPGTVTVIDASNGKVQLAPTNSSVFVASTGPYYARWQITDGTGKVSFCPTSVRDVWNIVGA